MLIVCGTSASSLLVEKMDVVNAALCLTGNDAPGPQSEIIARNATIFFARVFHARERVAESIIGFSSLNVTRHHERRTTVRGKREPVPVLAFLSFGLSNGQSSQPLLFAVHGTKDPYMVLAYYLCCTHTDALMCTCGSLYGYNPTVLPRQELLSEMLVSNQSEVTIYACQADQT
ncbi:hypothetical protein G5I_02014 [Acromyrmex echinatior]|uniref:Uncharacterized protein n=1 Tax=Acromyrmex echinatior TaxID=103372 RepID=F4W967_ACREC|nr:hypothetical protein G5I_02014 [Acromyrmex echinatior]